MEEAFLLKEKVEEFADARNGFTRHAFPANLSSIPYGSSRGNRGFLRSLQICSSVEMLK